jgi:hypothetical protein
MFMVTAVEQTPTETTMTKRMRIERGSGLIRDGQEEFVKEWSLLGWKIIEWKVAYYLPNLVHKSRIADYTISDDLYDEAEKRYLKLCRRVGLPNYNVHKKYPGFDDVSYKHAMFEVDRERPSVQLVLAKLGSPKEGARTRGRITRRERATIERPAPGLHGRKKATIRRRLNRSGEND